MVNITQSAGPASSALPLNLLDAYRPVPSPRRMQQRKMICAVSPIDLEEVEDIQNEENDLPDAVVDSDVVDKFKNEGNAVVDNDVVQNEGSFVMDAVDNDVKDEGHKAKECCPKYCIL